MHDEILKLKQLLDQGVLTEEEFAAAKRKLLGMDGSVQQTKEASDPKPITKPVPPPFKSGFAPAPYKEPSLPSYVSQTKSTMECPKCLEPIPQSAVVCPACGCSISSINRSVKECPRCHRKYIASKNGCPFCSDEKEGKTSSNKRRFLVLIVAFVVSVCFINYLVKSNDDVKSKSSYTTSQTSSIAAQGSTSTPKPVATKTPNPTAKPSLKTLLNTIGKAADKTLEGKNVTFWTSESGVYVTVGMSLRKSELQSLITKEKYQQYYKEYKDAIQKMSTDSWNLLVNNGYGETAVCLFELVGYGDGSKILEYVNGKKTYDLFAK